MTAHSTDSQNAWDLIEQFSFCMLVTHDGPDGMMRSRPMSPHCRPEDGAIFFLTDVRNHKDEEIRADRHVCLTFADTTGQTFVSVSGVANILDDREKISELWSLATRAWWSSKDDPNIRLLHVVPSQAEYWDGPGTLVASVKMAAAALTGTRPEMGENKKVLL
jgi:general stress protein 26